GGHHRLVHGFSRRRAGRLGNRQPDRPAGRGGRPPPPVGRTGPAGPGTGGRTVSRTGRRVGGSGPPPPSVERARMREDLAEVVPYAETLIEEFTGLSTAGGPRAWSR